MHENTDLPLPPSFPVEKWKDKLRVFKDASSVKQHISEVLKKVFPQETFGNTRGVGVVWKPHNFRLKFMLKKNIKDILVAANTNQEIKGVLGLLHMKVYRRNFNTKWFVRGVDRNILLEINPNSIQAIFIGESWLKVEVLGFEDFVDKKVKEIYSLCLNAVNKLSLSSLIDFSSASWLRQENALKGEEFLDGIPKKLLVDDTTFKKVYDEHVEFKDASFVKSYIKNRVVENFYDYHARISALEEVFALSNPFAFIFQNIKGVQDIFPGGCLSRFWDCLDVDSKNRLFSEVF